MNMLACPPLPKLNLKQGVAHKVSRLYLPRVAANSATGICSPIKLAHQRPKSIGRRFFTSVAMLYGGCARDTFGYAGCQLSRSANLCTVATQSCFAAGSGDSRSQVGAIPMQFSLTLNPSVESSKAAAHRAMAFAALRANSSLAVRLARFNSHMAKSRALETVGGAV